MEHREVEAGELAVGGGADIVRGGMTRLKGGLEAKETRRIGTGRTVEGGLERTAWERATVPVPREFGGGGGRGGRGGVAAAVNMRKRTTGGFGFRAPSCRDRRAARRPVLV